MPKDEPAAIKPSSASESRGMKDPDQLWALDIEPDLDALDDDMKKYFDIAATSWACCLTSCAPMASTRPNWRPSSTPTTR